MVMMALCTDDNDDDYSFERWKVPLNKPAERVDQTLIKSEKCLIA